MKQEKTTEEKLKEDNIIEEIVKDVGYKERSPEVRRLIRKGFQDGKKEDIKIMEELKRENKILKHNLHNLAKHSIKLEIEKEEPTKK